MRTLWETEKRSISFQDVWGSGADWSGRQSAARVPVNVDTALGLSAVLRSVRLLSDTVASLPIHAYSGGTADLRLPVQPRLVSDPSLVLTPREWRAQAMVSVLLWGNAYGVVLDRDRMGVPETVEWVLPDHMQVERSSQLGRPRYRLSGDPMPAEDVLHIRGFTKPGAVVGSPPLTLQRETIGLGIAAQKFGAQWFGDGAHPSAVLTSEHAVNQEQAQTIKDRFLMAIRGKREPAVLGGGMTYQQVQVAANESQFLETHEAVINDVARAFGLSPEMIGGSGTGGQNVTYANREQSAIDFLTFSISPWLVTLEDSISAMLRDGEYVKFNPDALLRTDTMSRYKAHQTALDSHFLTIDEVRALEDRAPLDNGEVFPPSRITGKPKNADGQEVEE